MRTPFVCLLVSLASLAALTPACVQSPSTDDPGPDGPYADLRYDFTWKRSCFCGDELRRPVRISVDHGAITKAVFLDDQRPVDASIREGLSTIDGVFELARRAEDAGQEVSVMIATDGGDPIVVTFDASKIPADGGMTLKLSDIVVHGRSRVSG